MKINELAYKLYLKDCNENTDGGVIPLYENFIYVLSKNSDWFDKYYKIAEQQIRKEKLDKINVYDKFL